MWFLHENIQGIRKHRSSRCNGDLSRSEKVANELLHPQTLTQLKSLLRFVNIFRRLIPRFIQLAQPFYNTQKGLDVKRLRLYEQNHLNSFQKNWLICSAPSSRSSKTRPEILFGYGCECWSIWLWAVSNFQIQNAQTIWLLVQYAEQNGK